MLELFDKLQVSFAEYALLKRRYSAKEACILIEWL